MKLFTKFSRPTKTNKLSTYIVTAVCFAIALLLVNSGVGGSQLKGLIIPIGIYIILAVSLNLVVGVLGELSLGHAGFMCVGAYVGSMFSLLTKETISSDYIRFALAIIVGGIAAAIFGFIIGIPVLRLSGDYLAIVTLAFGEIIKNIIQNLYICTDVNGIHFAFSAFKSDQVDMATKKDLLKGAQGVTGTPKDTTILITIIMVFVTLFVIMNVIDSRSGRAFTALRDNKIAAESIGISVTRYKLTAFVLSAFFAGIAGVLYSHNLNSVVPTKFNYNLSILILVYVVLGGIGSIRGTVIATVILYALPELLRQFQDYRMLAYAIVLIAIMILNNNKHFKMFKEKISPKNLFKRKKKEVSDNVDA